MGKYILTEERFLTLKIIQPRVLRVHLHNSLAHLACYPLPRNHCSGQSSATGNVILDQLITNSSSSDVPPNSTFVAGTAAASNAARSNLQRLALELLRPLLLGDRE